MIEYIVERSANHAHLTEEAAFAIFGDAALPENLTLKPLAICGEFASNLKVKDILGNSYTVVYPWRKNSQIEVSQSDYYKMFKTYADRVDSGGIVGAKTIKVLGCAELPIPVIVVRAHIHIPPNMDFTPIHDQNVVFPLVVKFNETIDGIPRIHLDADQYAAIQGIHPASFA